MLQTAEGERLLKAADAGDLYCTLDSNVAKIKLEKCYIPEMEANSSIYKIK